MTRLQKETQAGPSGGVPEVGAVTRGDDSCMPVIVPKGLPVGQDMEVEDSDIGDVCVCVLVSNKKN